MGARGPAGKTTKQKLLEGNPGKTKLPTDYVEPVGDVRRPDHIDGYAAEVWERVVAAMPPGVYKATDTGLLAAYCLACARQRDAVYRVKLEGEVITVNGQYGPKPVRNPWAVMLTEANAQIASLGTKLGLDPIARESIKAPKNPGSGKFGALVGINGGKAAG
jgi:P27 family predicted phage terminase small subunit